MNAVEETSEQAKAPRLNRLLPYLAVFQEDVRQTLRSWVYRAWVLLSLLVALGYLLYRFGAYQEAHFVPSASHLLSDLLRWSLYGSVTLIIVLTAGSISPELGTLADSVLSRGISRHQYYLGKWHARLATVLVTFMLLGLVVLAGSIYLLRDDNVTLVGGLVALGMVAALLAVVVTCGVTVSALCGSTVLGIAAVWMVLYGSGFVLSLMPASWPSPDRALANLPVTLCGQYDPESLRRLLLACLGCCAGATLLGMSSFSRRDV